MKFKKIETIASFMLCASLFAMPALAKVKDVNISNDTAYTLTFSVNGICSQEFGVVDRYSMKTVTEQNFKKACKNATTPCEVVIYSSKSCEGVTFATIDYNLDTNNVEVHGHDVPRIGVGVRGYDIFLVQAMDNKNSI